MTAIVQKYGGTSVMDAERIRAVAARVARTRRAGHDVVVIVSAMGHTTDQFLRLCREVSPNEHPREMDMLLTAGERISMALLAMAIRDLGLEAVSLTGSQAGILTDTVHGRAEIQDVRAFRVRDHLDRGDVVIVAGFQGVSASNKEITTLGRGGSDVTAVAMAAYLQAEACEIYKDVDGVFTADPRVVPGARKLEEVSYEEMAELAVAGAQVLMLRSVQYGRRLGVPLHVRSSFHEGEGTWVRDTAARRAPVTGVAHTPGQVLVEVAGAGDPSGTALEAALLTAGLESDLVGPVGREAGHPLGFVVPAEQAAAACRAAAGLGLAAAAGVELLGTVSVIGDGLRSDPGLAARVPRLLAGAGIEVVATRALPIRVSCLVPEGRLEEAVRLLHGAFIEVAP
ncbi:MAG TPA: aspartate kinase [Acidimicrobiia bacterium]|nr:aspartate kinase [Acidimicrobiia bacterium]